MKGDGHYYEKNHGNPGRTRACGPPSKVPLSAAEREENMHITDYGFEPGCAVRAAVARGELSEERLKSYLKLKREARYIENRNAYLHEHSMQARKRMKERRQRKMEQR